MFVGARIKHGKIPIRIETLYTRDVARETRPTAHRSHNFTFGGGPAVGGRTIHKPFEPIELAPEEMV